MEKSVVRSNLSIIVATMNRPDFVIRQLNYYANLNSPHTIYYTDASSPENSKIIKAEIDKLKDRLNIVYQFSPAGDTIRSLIELLSIVQEKYTTFIGDDDYHVSNTLSACAEFLENNPDYQTAMGRSVTIRVEGNEVCGKLVGIHDYPRYSIESDNASQRLFDYLGPYFTSIIAAVLPTKTMLKYFEDGHKIKDLNIKGELLPCCRMIVDGKSKILDRLGLVRQIHNRHLHVDNMFDKITNPDWNSDYQDMRQQIVEALSIKDKITPQEAELSFKKAFWFNFQKYISIDYFDNFPKKNPQKKSVLKNIRAVIAYRLPLLKRFYRTIKPIFSDKPQLHYEVVQPNSKYYRDFKAIVDSLAEPKLG